MIRLLAQEGTTIVLTTRSLEEAQALADRLTVVSAEKRKKVVAEGEPAALREQSGTQATVEWTEPTEPRARSVRRPRPVRSPV